MTAGAQYAEVVRLPSRVAGTDKAVGPARGRSQMAGQWLGQGWRGLVAGGPEMTTAGPAKSFIRDQSGPEGAGPGRSNLYFIAITL